MTDENLSDLCVNTIKFLALDAIERARSGHPGMCMGAADAAFVLWTRFLRFDPASPEWPDRDRFVLSAGHASMMLYSLLHLAGYDLPVEELKRFRQLGSRTAGHPERGHAPGVEMTTGPLGQGFAHAVGMALAGRMLAARFNRPGHPMVAHRVFVMCGDGDMMEGVTNEAASLAGHLGLGNLVAIYDSNRITIEGSTDLAFTESVGRRFDALGWRVQECDGYDRYAIARCIESALDDPDHPGLIVSHSEIGHGAPTMHGTARTHGSPLGAAEVRLAKEAAGWPIEPGFHVPGEVRAAFARVAAKGRAEREGWERAFARYRVEHADLAAEWDARFSRSCPSGLPDMLIEAATRASGKATRVVGHEVLQAAHRLVPGLVGGSADLAPSNETVIEGAAHVVPAEGPGRFDGANLHFGIREHAMAAAVNGMALSGAFRPFGATFLVFADYMKPALRLAALMRCPSIFVFTHDSYAVGEDGPTHQPIEQLWMLRSIPGFTVFRPADAVEVAAAWFFALRTAEGPVAICLTRQNVPAFPRPADSGVDDCLRGAYVVLDHDGPDVVIVATGSEVPAALEAAAMLATQGSRPRVVSMPSVELFFTQPEEYRRGVLPPGVKTVVVEAGSTVGWHRITGLDGLAVGLDRFGDSAPAGVLAEEYGFTGLGLARRIREWLGACCA